jgi:hypothetical protein
MLIAVSSYAQQAPSSVVHLKDDNEPGKPFTLDIKRSSGFSVEF